VSKSTNLYDTITSQTQSENVLIGKAQREKAQLIDAIQKSKAKEVELVRKQLFPQVLESGVSDSTHMLLNAYQPSSYIKK